MWMKPVFIYFSPTASIMSRFKLTKSRVEEMKSHLMREFDQQMLPTSRKWIHLQRFRLTIVDHDSNLFAALRKSPIFTLHVKFFRYSFTHGYQAWDCSWAVVWFSIVTLVDSCRVYKLWKSSFHTNMFIYFQIFSYLSS